MAIQYITINTSMIEKTYKTNSLRQKSFFGTITKVITDWSHRLTVRTPGFHPGNPGSIPGEITKENGSGLSDLGRFLWANLFAWNRTRRGSILPGNSD